MNRDDSVAELIQDAWLVTLRKLSALEPRDGHYTPVLVKFLGTTCVYLCNNYLKAHIRGVQSGRDGIRSPQVSTMDRFAEDTRDVVSKVASSEVQEQVRLALGRLPEDKQNILVLRLIEQRSNLEIAEILHLNPNTVAQRYRRAIRELRALLPESVFQEIWSATERDSHE